MSMLAMPELVRPSRLPIVTLRSGASGTMVRALASDLASLGYLPSGDGYGLYDRELEAAVRRFQMKGIGANGLPLLVDGTVGVQTRFGLDLALGHEIDAPNNCLLPPPLGDRPEAVSSTAWGALQAAMLEIENGAQEIGGTGEGPYCRQYLDAAGLGEGSDWGVPFVAWCLGQTRLGSATAVLECGRSLGWIDGPLPGPSAPAPPAPTLPVLPGDLVLWRCEHDPRFAGHAAIVVGLEGDRVFTVEGGRTPFVEFFHHSWRHLAGRVNLVRPVDAGAVQA